MTWDPNSFTGDRLYLDTNVIIAAVEQGNPWIKELRELFVAIDEQAVHAFTSELTLGEVLVKPLAIAANDLVATYEELLAAEGMVKVAPIDRAILRSAAGLRGQLGVKLADAIHVATAVQSSCAFFVTDDGRLGRKVPQSLRWLSLDEMFGAGRGRA